MLTCPEARALAVQHEILGDNPAKAYMTIHWGPSYTTGLAQLQTLATRYADREPDLADLCLIRMSELHPKLPVITVDRKDFRIYRRNQREMIPLICPPG